MSAMKARCISCMRSASLPAKMSCKRRFACIDLSRPGLPLLRIRHSVNRPRAYSLLSAPRCAASAVLSSPVSIAAVPSATKIVAVVLGYCCLAGSCFRSVPQILKVWGNQSAEGLSVTTNIVELLCYTVVVAYNLNQDYAINTFGEVIACWLQDIVLVIMLFAFNNVSLLKSVPSMMLFAAICTWLFSGSCPPRLLAGLQVATIVIMPLFARLPQIILNVRRGNSGMLSATTCVLNVAGNMVRIFTTLVLTGDRLMLASSITQGMLNSVLLYQTMQTVLRAGEQRAGREGLAGKQFGVSSGGVPAVA